MTDERDGLSAALSWAALIAAMVAWAPAGLFLAGLAAALVDPEGIGCTWDAYGDVFTMGTALWIGSVGSLAAILGVGAVTRNLSDPEPVAVSGAFSGLALALAAIPSSVAVLWTHGVFNDGLCWSQNVVSGRPLRVSKECRTAQIEPRSDWSGSATEVTPAVGARAAALGQGWEETALGEHAAVAAFARLTLDLLAVGAPSDLVRRSLVAALDEVRHAEAAFAVAGVYRGAPVGPSALRTGQGTTLARVVAQTWADGVVGEALSAEVMRAAAQRTDDAVVSALLHRVAEDEKAHVALAADLIAWAVSRDPTVVDLLADPPVAAPHAPALAEGVQADTAACWPDVQRRARAYRETLVRRAAGDPSAETPISGARSSRVA